MSKTFTSADELADAVIEHVGKDLVVGLPVGIGKAIHVIDALYERALSDPSIKLTLFSGLSLAKPRAGQGLQAKFLKPIIERLYEGYPTPRYVTARGKQQLPANIRVQEFYFRPGELLKNPQAQQDYSSINYSEVAGELTKLGVNVIAQLVAADPSKPDCLSLGSNPEVTLDLLPSFAERANTGVAFIGEINENMPYMEGDAEIGKQRFDFLLHTTSPHYPLFTVPNRKVSVTDYAVGMHVASLIPDGGTLQLGIGSFSDAVAYCLKLRNDSPAVFKETLKLLCKEVADKQPDVKRHTETFSEGLYASTELMSDALYSLYQHGIIRRPADKHSNTVIHAGFFIGSNNLYRSLRTLSKEQREQINMTAISYVNTLYGDEKSKRIQRTNARFVNETMIVTLLGGAASDTLEGARVVSGVGGQFDFVSMGHQLQDAHSVLMLRARREHKGKITSNIKFEYPHLTVPRHHRDIIVSEYGVAATRGKTDEETIQNILAISDSDFQQELADKAIAAGKLSKTYSTPEHKNHPEVLLATFNKKTIKPHFPDYPLGTELDDIEQVILNALEWLQQSTNGRLAFLKVLIPALLSSPQESHSPYINRMDFSKTQGIKDYIEMKLFRYALTKQRSV